MSRKVGLIRWIHQLHPSLSKIKWTEAESKKLFELHREQGSHWKNISVFFPGRTDNFLKNQFFSLIRRSIRRLTKFLKIPKSRLYQPCSPSTRSSPRCSRISCPWTACCGGEWPSTARP